MDTDPYSDAAGCSLYVVGVFLFGISLRAMLHALFTHDSAELVAGGALTVIATAPVFFGVVLCRTGLRSSFRRAFTIRRVMKLIAVVAVLLFLFVDEPVVVLTILGFVIVFWPIPVYIANYLDDPG